VPDLQKKQNCVGVGVGVRVAVRVGVSVADGELVEVAVVVGVAPPEFGLISGTKVDQGLVPLSPDSANSPATQTVSSATTDRPVLVGSTAAPE
jgi:hypothetical protein